MKLSNTTIRELNAQYRSVLKKCFMLNAAILMGVALASPAMAAEEPFLATDNQVLSDTYTGYLNTDGTKAGVATVDYTTADVSVENGTVFKGNETQASAGGALKIMNGIDIGDDVQFIENEATTNAWGGGAMYIKVANGDVASEDTSVTIGRNVLFDGNKALANSGLGGAIALEYADLTIGEGATFQNNSANGGGAIAMWKDATDHPSLESSLTLNGVTFDTNTATASGGALLVGADSGTVTVSNGTFKNNTAGSHGGAIYNEGEMTFNGDTLFSKNTATNGLGGALFNAGNAVFNDDITFSGNDALNGRGGAIAGYGEGSVLFNGDAVFSGNSAGLYGGAIYNQNTSSLTFKGDVEFSGNSAYLGGAILEMGGGLTFEGNATFKGNKASSGGAIYNISEISLTGSHFESNEASVDGGAISVYGVASLTDVSFKGNSAGEQGGAILYFLDALTPLTITGGSFTENTAVGAGGAISAFAGNMDISNGTTFTGNTVTDGKGGAIFLGAESGTFITDAIFNGNTATVAGGAISGREIEIANNQAASLDVVSTKFLNNSSAGNGGAIHNTFYNSKTNAGFVTIASSEFTGNSATNGGAIYNDGRGDKGSNFAAMMISDTTFSGNTASANGGAIYNAANGVITLAGTNTFTGNTAAEGADIFNEGSLTVAASGTTTIDGGIAGTGTLNVAGTLNINTAKVEQGTINFNSGKLVANLLNTSSYGALNAGTVTGSGTLELTVGAAGTYEVITGTGADVNNFTVNTSGGFFDFATDDTVTDKVVVTATAKSTEDIAEAAGGISNESATVVGALASADNQTASQITMNLQQLAASGNAAAIEEATETLSPTNSSTVQSVSASVNGQIISAAMGRISASPAAQGRAAGDVEVNSVGPWAKVLYNATEQDASSGNAGFNGHTKGIALGIDTKINDAYTVGIGYAYSKTDVKSGARKTDIYGHNIFVYGEYQPDAWYINGALSYGMSDYKEDKVVTGLKVNGKYDVDTIAAQAMTGYDMASGLTPEVGVRYLHIKQDSYTDTAGLNVKTDDTDILTAVVGGRFAAGDFVKDDMVLTPELRLAATYDVVSDNSNATVSVGSVSYASNGKRLPRFGVEAGVGLTLAVGENTDIKLDYDAGIRRDYTSHTGTLSLKYNF